MEELYKICKFLICVSTLAMLLLFCMILVSTLLFYGIFVFGAPAPSYKPPKPRDLDCAEYHLNWGGTSCRVRLKKDGVWECRWASCDWLGTWHWDSKNRVLYVQESGDTVTLLEWMAKLDKDFKGTCRVGVRDIPIEMKRIK